MGYHRHHAIVVTSWDEGHITKAHNEATRVFSDTPAAVSEITAPAVNSYQSFFVAPDGSKEGWSDSDRGDAAREQYVAWLRDASSRGVYVEWAEVNFGGDDREYVGVRSAYGKLWGKADDDA